MKITSTRPLNRITLDNAASYYAREFKRPDAYDPRVPTRLIGGRNFALQNFRNFTFADEMLYLRGKVEELLDRADVPHWRRCIAEFDSPDQATFEERLKVKLAIDPTGAHIEGCVGTTQIGARRVGKQVTPLEVFAQRHWGDPRRWFGVKGKLVECRYKVRNVYWPVYAGEIEERERGSDAVDPLPEGADTWPPTTFMATNPRISNEAAIAACDAIVDRLDEGTGAAVIQGRTGAQPADPDTAVTGTLLFTLVMSDPAFGAAADANPGGRATASAITDDSSADATGTLGYCRCSATNDGATPLDDHIDGEAGTSGADFNFNTVSIVAGATVSMTSFTVTVPES